MRVCYLAIVAVALAVGCESGPRRCYKNTTQSGQVYHEFANRVYLGVDSVGIDREDGTGYYQTWIYNPASVETYYEDSTAGRQR